MDKDLEESLSSPMRQKPPQSFLPAARNMPGSRPKLLSVEDHPETQILLKRGLKERYDVTVVSCEEEARAALVEKSFDAALLDIKLIRRKGGVDLLRYIRERDGVPDLPAIAVTAYAMPGDRKEILREGFDGYVAKPFTLESLRETIDQTLTA